MKPGARPLVLTGLSVRAWAEAAQREGWRVFGLDVCGDADTRAACARWAPLALAGDPARGAWRIDPASLRAAWTRLCEEAAAAGEAAPLGLLPGSGFEAEGAELVDLPLLGVGAAERARLRDPARFFAALDALGLAHPPVSLRPRPEPGWLRKDAGGCGGAEVLPADRPEALAAGAGPRVHWQQRLLGESLSLTVIAGPDEDGSEGAALLGLNRQLGHPSAAAPYRWGGVIGPLPMAAPQRAALQDLADRLVRRFGLRGLVGIDLLHQGPAPQERWVVLEVNPRPPASAALYGHDGRGTGLITAHLRAAGALDGPARRPDAATLARLRGPAGLRGLELWRDDRAATVLDAAACARLQAQAEALGLHDLPAAAQAVPAGAPIATLRAALPTGDAAALRRLLSRRLAEAQALLAPNPPPAGAPRQPRPCGAVCATP